MISSCPSDAGAVKVQHNRELVSCAVGRYRADITAGSLKIVESRVIAELLLCGVDESEWKQATVKDNVLKTKNPATATPPKESVAPKCLKSGSIPKPPRG